MITLCVVQDLTRKPGRILALAEEGSAESELSDCMKYMNM